MKTNGWLRLGSLLVLTALGSWATPALAQVQVTSANPNSAPQGSTNLIVKIGGSGFKKGAQSTFYVTGTTDPGGITVNSTAFVGDAEVDANITVSSTASVSGFDIYVTSGGRTGKGNDLFSVTSNPNANPGCVTKGPAAGWTQVGLLNPPNSSGTPLYTAGALGIAVRVKLVSVAGVPQFYAGLAGSGAGAQTIAFVLNLDGTVRRSWLVLSNHNAEDIEVGDINGDGAPDFIMGTYNQNQAFAFFGHLVTNSSGNWDYNIDPATDVVQIPTPAGAPSTFGWRVAIGDLNGDGLDEVVVASQPEKTTKGSPPGIVYIFAYINSTWSMIKQLNDPGQLAADRFGSGLAVGQLTTDGVGTRIPDLAVDASGAGLVYVYQNPLGSQSLPYLTFPVSGAGAFGSHLATADVNGDGFPDLIAVASGTVEEFSGPLYPGESPEYTLLPDPSLTATWGTGFDVAEMDGDGRADVVVGDPQASYSPNCAPGAAFAFRTGSAAFPGYSDVFEVPVLGFAGFGHSVAAAQFNSKVGQPIMLIGAPPATVGTQTGAGQVYIYRKTQ